MNVINHVTYNTLFKNRYNRYMYRKRN